MSDLRKLVEELMPILDRWKMTYPPCSGADWDKVEALRTALEESANSTTDFVEPKAVIQPKQEPTQEIYAVLFAVEEAVRNGCAPWDIEAAFEKYEAKVKEIK